MLGICIPNYNRIEKLNELLLEIINQIKKDYLHDLVQICISDDHSLEDPTVMVNEIIELNPDIRIKYNRKKVNQGMDFNFKDSVLMSDEEYCWIIGNDDLPCPDGVKKVIEFIRNHSDMDFLVTMFDVFNSEYGYRNSVYPIKGKRNLRFDTRNGEERRKLLEAVNHNSGVFAFLSNVVFKRKIWVEREKKFDDKMNSIFIQMYMNIDALMDGSVYYYSLDKVIKNISDDETNNTEERIGKILVGLDSVVEYFFDDEIKSHFKKILTDAYVSGVVWDIDDRNPLKISIGSIRSPKNDIYKKYYISREQISNSFVGKKALIWGAGTYGHKAYDRLTECGVNVIGIADSNIEIVGHKFECHEIMSVNQLIAMGKCSEILIVPASYFGLCDMVKILNENGLSNIAVVC